MCVFKPTLQSFSGEGTGKAERLRTTWSKKFHVTLQYAEDLLDFFVRAFKNAKIYQENCMRPIHQNPFTRMCLRSKLNHYWLKYGETFNHSPTISIDPSKTAEKINVTITSLVKRTR